MSAKAIQQRKEIRRLKGSLPQQRIAVLDPRRIDFKNEEIQKDICEAFAWFIAKNPQDRLGVILRAYAWRHLAGDAKI